MKDYISNNKIYTLISIIVILVLWTLASIIVGNSIKLPSPLETIEAFLEIISDKNFIFQIYTTLKRTLISFAIALVLGLSLGIISSFINPLFYLLKPIVSILTAMPTMAVILLSLIWLNREISPILVGFLIVFPIIYNSVVNSIKNVDTNLIEMAKIFDFSKKKKFFHLYFPSIKSTLITICATAISLNIKVIIAAEVLSQPKYSIGTSLQMEKTSLDTASVIAWSIIAILLSVLLETIILKFNLKKSTIENS